MQPRARWQRPAISSLGISSQGISSLGISLPGNQSPWESVSLGISSLGINESQRPKKFRFLPRTSDHKTKKTEANTTTQNLPLVRPTGKNERTTHLLGLRFLLLGFPCDQFTNTEPPPQAAEDGRPLTARTGREKSTPEDTDEPEARRALTHGTNCDPFTKTPPGTESQK